MVPFEIGDFDENGKFGQNCEMAKIRLSNMNKSNDMAKGRRLK